VVPGEQLAIPVVLINQGLGADTFGLAVEELPQAWVSIPTPGLPLEPGEVKETILVVQPPRRPDTRVGRRPFRILVTSQSALNRSQHRLLYCYVLPVHQHSGSSSTDQINPPGC
jgi:hypothetical protein